MTKLIEHPLRRQLVAEMHLRRWPPLAAPALLIQTLRLVDPAARAAEAALLEALPPGWTRAPTDNSRHHEGRCPSGHCWVWEQHQEASAFTLFVPAPTRAMLVDPGADPVLAERLGWIAQLPGEVIRATRIVLQSDEAGAEALLGDMAFAEPELVSCRLGGAPRIWSDFRIGHGGFGTLLVAANGMAPADLSRLVQRLQELGNYRNLALLGLPVARAGWQALDGIEQALVALSGEVARPEMRDDILLERVCALSLDLMSQATVGSFRMSATAAYAQLVDERLAELAPQPIAGFHSLADFTRRRLQPAIRTCAAHAEREEDLARRASAFVSLLRTRIETRIENQNARLLESMNRSSSLQLRLQQLVEGLSVVALSYYCIGLVSYVLKGVEAGDHRFPAYQLLALLTPLVVIGVAFAMHRFKHAVLSAHGHGKDMP